MNPLEHAVKSSQKIAPTTKRLYVKRVMEFIDYAGTDPRYWTGYRFEQWRDYLLKERGLKPKSVNLYMTAVSFAARRMERLGIGKNFAQAAERPVTHYQESPTEPLTLNQIRKLVGACAGRYGPELRDRAMILIALHAAFRREEIVTITFDDFDRRMITVTAKGGRRHTNPVGDEPWRALGDWVRWLGRKGVDKGLVFRSLRPSIEGTDEWHIGDSISAQAFADICRMRGESAGIEHVHPHRLRHTCSTLLDSMGIDRRVIQRIMGHRRSSMTEHYIHNEADVSQIKFPSFLEDE